MSLVSELRSRWATASGREMVQRVHALLVAGRPRGEFESVLSDLPLSGDLEGFVDLRGIPYSGPVPIDECNYFDFSFATKPKGSEHGELALHVGDYCHSRFAGIRFGVSVLAGKVSFCDFSASNSTRNDWSFSGDIVGTLFDDANLRWSRFFDQQIRDCSFRGSVLNNSGFAQVAFKNCRFEGASLKNTLFQECSFEDCTFNGADLTGSDLQRPADPASLATDLLQMALYLSAAQRDDLTSVIEQSLDFVLGSGAEDPTRNLSPDQQSRLDELLARAQQELEERG